MKTEGFFVTPAAIRRSDSVTPPARPPGNYPRPNDVRAGVTYDTNLVGTLVVTPPGNYPAASDVRLGVAYDAGLVGTLVVTTGASESGFGLGGYGDLYGSDTFVGTGAYTITTNVLFEPNYGVVGWGALDNANLDAVEALVNRIIVLEA